MVPAPSWRRSLADLDRGAGAPRAHVADGDYTIPTRPPTRVLNGSRILHALETGNVAISKREAGDWALDAPAGPMAPAPPGRDPQLRGACDAERRRAARGGHGALRRHGPRAPPRAESDLPMRPPACRATEPSSGREAEEGLRTEPGRGRRVFERLKTVDQTQALFLAGLVNDDPAWHGAREAMLDAARAADARPFLRRAQDEVTRWVNRWFSGGFQMSGYGRDISPPRPRSVRRRWCSTPSARSSCATCCRQTTSRC